jgi:hypothetical protein
VLESGCARTLATWVPDSKQEIVLVNLVPRSLTGTSAHWCVRPEKPCGLITQRTGITYRTNIPWTPKSTDVIGPDWILSVVGKVADGIVGCLQLGVVKISPIGWKREDSRIR